MRPSYSALEAPTHLRAGDLPPGLLDDPLTGAARPGHSISARPTHRRGEPAALPPPYDPADPHSIVSISRSRSVVEAAPRVPTEPASASPPSGRRVHGRQLEPRSGVIVERTPPSAAGPLVPQAHAPQPTPHSRSSSAPQVAPQATPHSRSGSAPHSVPQATPHSKSGSAPQATPHSRSGSTPSKSGPSAQAAQAAQAAAGLGAIDPMSIPTPPELAGPIYAYIRRLALQADLTGADRVLRDALAELTSSLSCSIVYPGQDGLWTLGADDEIPRDAQPLVAVATARRAVIATHVAMIPVVTTSETVAVITVTRNARQPAYQPVEQIAMVALAREAAPILHHLAVQHLQRASEIKADKGSLYRGEALEAHRTRGQEGVLVQLSPAWVKRAYPVLIITIIAAVIFAVFVKVPTYSTGTAVIVFEGSTSVTATAGGTVEAVLVKENEAVKKGDPLVRLNSPEEAAQLAASETEWRDTKIQFLFDQTDEQVRKSLMSAANNRDHALARVEARTIRAPRDGVVTNLHVKEGVPLQPGGYVMQITDENSEIEVLAFLPGKDGPRLRDNMKVQLDLDGYTSAHPTAAITHIQADAVSGQEAAKLGGDLLAETVAKDLQTGATWIAIRGRLPERTFKSGHNTYRYHHGMHAKVEVKILSKPFLVTLLPVIEKYLPD